MVKKMLINNGWKQKTIRIKLDYNRLCDFLIFNEKKEDREIRKMHDSIFNYSLDYINDSENYKKYEILRYRGRREPKGFLLEEKTIERLEKEYNKFSENLKLKYNMQITLGEFTEFLIFIWCRRELPKEVFEFLQIDWGFRQKETNIIENDFNNKINDN